MNDTLKPYIVAKEGADEQSASTSVAPKTPEELHPGIIDALKTVYDPEIPVNIYDLGLIYNFTVDENFFVDVVMTLTAPGCPKAKNYQST